MFKIQVVVEKPGIVNEIDWKGHLKEFASKCNRIFTLDFFLSVIYRYRNYNVVFRKGLRSYEYMLFLQTLLEYDYAAAILNNSSDYEKCGSRTHNFKEQNDIKDIPLAYIGLLCHINLAVLDATTTKPSDATKSTTKSKSTDDDKPTKQQKQAQAKFSSQMTELSSDKHTYTDLITRYEIVSDRKVLLVKFE
jgi:hypothetical protein